MSPGRRLYPARALSRYCLLLLCLLPVLVSADVNAQTYVRTVVIGVIPDSKAPLSPNPTSQPPMAPPLSNVPPEVVDIYGQPVNFDTGHADLAHHVIVDNFGGGEAGEKKANAARQSAANLTADDSLFNRFSRAWDGSSFDAISGKPGSSDPVNIGPGAPASSTPFFNASAGVASQQQQVAIMARFDGDPPGGVMLEGTFDPGTLNSVVYDARYHALVLETPGGGRAVYFSIPAQDVVTLCHAIAGDDQMRVAVSLSHPPRIYGALPGGSNVALNMFVGDGLLGAITFGSMSDTHDMIADFRLAGGYAIEAPPNKIQPLSVGFTFRTDNYRDDGKSLTPSENALNILFTPLAPSNGHYVAAMTTDVSSALLANVRHISGNLDYYRGEPIVTLIFRYAQTASLLRGLKDENVDLNQLAQGIEFATRGPK